MFDDKRVLFFSANFFGYQTEIKKGLARLGAHVDFYDERPKNTFWTKALIRIDKRVMKGRIQKYYNQIIEISSKTEYDYVFFLKAEVITFTLLNELRQRQPKAKFILYMWDSIKNSGQDIEELLPLFDKVLSFDRIDAEKNSFMVFRPLFYLNEYSKIADDSVENVYDITFVGTGHTDRYALVSKVKALCQENGLNGYFFMYLQDVRVFLARKLFQKSFKKAKRKDFSFSPLETIEIVEIIRKSNCILDIQRSVQSGLTMRTLEVLGAKKKLITTNEDIVNYDFYNELNICVINRKNPKIKTEFIKGKFHPVESDVYEKYSLDAWLYEVFQ